MITFKNIDVYGQMILTVTAVVITIISLEMMLTLLLYCFVIGCWQVLSAIIHFGYRQKLFTIKERKLYLLFVLIFFTVISIFNAAGVVNKYPFWVTFSVAPLMAVWYITISLRELTIWEKRRLIQFK